MADSWCRVSVSWGATVTDLVLSKDIAVGAVLPEVVESIVAPDSATTGNWGLSRPSGVPLDEDMTLPQNGIRDGDVLVLCASPVPVFVRAIGDFGTVGAAEAPRVRSCGAAAWAYCAALAAATVLGSVVHSGAVMVAPVIAAGVAVTAAVVARRAGTVRVATAAAAVAVCFGAAAGYLVVGAVSPTAGALLGAAAAGSSAVVLARFTLGDTVFLSAVGTAATLLTVALAPMALRAAGPAVGASILCVTAIGVLGAAARLVIVLTGLTPVLPGRDATRISGRRARRARRVLTGVVTGGAAAAASGCVLLAVGSAGRAAEPALAAVVTGAVLLRSRTYADDGCRTALIAGGLACAGATSVLLLRWVPAQAGWVTAAVAAAPAMMYAQRTAFSPSVTRAVDTAEVALLAAVLPLAGWCAGIFAAARDLSLPW